MDKITQVSQFWTGAGTTSAPSPGSLAPFTVGVNLDGVAAANVYWVINGVWVDTGATVKNLFGGA